MPVTEGLLCSKFKGKGGTSMTGQLDLFDGVKLAEPEPTTTVRLGRKTVQIPLRKKRREAVKRLMERRGATGIV